MQIAVFAKKRTTKATNKTFYTYLSRLANASTGEVISVSVKFPEGTEPDPGDCPMNIVFEKVDANLSSQRYENSNGDPAISHTLWVKNWHTGDPYVDDSLDDFE